MAELRTFHTLTIDTGDENWSARPDLVQNADYGFVLNVRHQGAEIDLSGVRDVILISQPPKRGEVPVISDGTVSGESQVTVPIKRGEVAWPGVVKAQLKLLGTDGGLISTLRFEYQVQEDVDNGAVPSTEERTYFEEAVEQLHASKAEADRATKDADATRARLTGEVGKAIQTLNEDKAAAIEQMETTTSAAVTSLNQDKAAALEQMETSRTGALKDVADAIARTDKSREDMTSAVAAALEETTRERQATAQVRQETEKARDAALVATAHADESAEAATASASRAEKAAKNAEAAIDDFKQAKSAPIYGVHWNRKSSPTLTRTDDAAGMVANVGLEGEAVRNDFDRASLYREIRTVVDLYGNRFVRIPKHYKEKKRLADSWVERVSMEPFQNSWLSPIFVDAETGQELPYVDIGAHLASLSDDGLRLESKPGKKPLVSRTIIQFRELAKANNTDERMGYQLLDLMAIDIIQSLMFIEFATLDMQTVMVGRTAGRYNSADTILEAGTTNRLVVTPATAGQFQIGQNVNVGTSLGAQNVATDRKVLEINSLDASRSEIVVDGDPITVAVDNIVYSVAWDTGSALQTAASSGGIGSLTSGSYPMHWRGIENVYGDIYQWIDGVNISDWQAWVCTDPEQYQSNVFAKPYKQLGYVNSQEDGYPVEMGFDPAYPFAEFATKVGGSSTTYYSDYYYQAAGSRVARFGGSWSNGRSAGLSLWTLIYFSASANLSIGGRLVKRPIELTRPEVSA